MSQLISTSVGGNLGNIAGPASDGVLLGQLTAADPTSVQRKGQAFAALCISDDGGLYVDETTPLGESTGDDVEVLPATPAAEDACYFGHASKTFAQIDLNETTQGDGVWTITWEYWNGAAWTALSGVTDGTTGFTAATGWVSVTFTLPTDWATCLVDGVLGYWVRARVSAYTSVVTAPQIGQGYLVDDDNAVWTDDTTDFTDAGAGDVDLLPVYPVAGDGLYIGYSEKFCKIKVTTSQETTGTAVVISLRYWNGSAWTTVTAAQVDDDSAAYVSTAGTHYIHFVPPSDWVANTTSNGPNSKAGFHVVMELISFTAVTQQPLATQGWVYPITTGASGQSCPAAGTINKVEMQAQTISATNADSIFVLLNATKGTFVMFTWTKADAFDSVDVSLVCALNDNLLIIQVTEDGTTEFADAEFNLTLLA